MNDLYLSGNGFDLDHHFRIDKKFLNNYKDKKPNFGFNGLGELVFYRTYSRIMPNGQKEAFLDTLTRVVEGCYEVQRRHCVRLHIPWDKKKAQRSAQEMFQRMWDFKFLPPGRGLWMMGTEFMWSRGSASLNNCFDAKTEIITRDGIKPIGDLVGTEQELLTTGGKWVKAPIKSFGVQELYKLTLERSGVEKVVYTTAGHRWFAKDRRKTQTVVESTTGMVVKKRQLLGYKELTTVELNEHHTMRSVYGNGINGNIRPSAFGIAHGIAFGDGTTGQDSESCGTYLYLCGSKNEELLEYFPNCPTSFDAAKGSEGAVRVADLPRFFRRKPQLRESKSYLYGWLAGYFAADGTINKKGNQVVIASSNYENMLLVRDICAVLGIGTNSIVQTTQTVLHDGVKKKFVGYKIGLVAAHLNSDFFLLSEHKKRFNEHSSHRDRPIYKWRVKSVEQTGEFAEVYCAQVPGTQAFALADNILTGNCAFVSTSGLSEADPAEPFCFLMDMSMLGVGVGFDTKGAGHIKIGKPANKTFTYVIDDCREGWVGSLRHLIASYTNSREDGVVEFDYSKIRPEGSLINGFGGKASGSKILVELHGMVRDHLNKCVGKTLSSVDITDIMNYIGRCVVAGNVRRTAEIAFGEADDPDYCNMKNPLRGLTSEEVSKFYACTGKIYAAGKGKGTLEDFKESGIAEEKLIPAIDTWNALNHHRWASNNSIFAKVGMDYSTVGNQIAVNGEPGLMWLDNARDYGRFIDGKQPGIDGRVMGSNPCFAGHMRLLTREGYRTIEDMWRIGGEHLYASDKPLADYGTIEIVNRLGVVSATNVYKTDDNAEIFKVLYDDGQSIEATSNHRFVVMRDGVECIVHLADLAQGDMSPLATNASFGAHEDRETALLAGWVIGDGSLSPQRNGQLTAHVTCYADDVDDVMPVLKQKLHEVYDANVATAGIKPSFEPWHRMHKHFSHAQSSIRSNVLGRLLRESGIESGSKHRVPNFVWGSNAETVSAFLRGLFSADGSVQTNQKKGTMSVRLTQANRQLLCDCQLLLSQFGIHSKVLSRRKPRLLKMNDGNGGMKEYKTQEMFELIISRRSNVVKFAENIGFIQARKNDKLSNWLDSHGGSNNSADNTYRKVVSIEYVGTGATYCLTEPQSTLLTVQGQVIGNCVEQSLESYELCCLVETFPASHADAADYLRTLKFAYLYAKTVTLLPTHNARTNQVMLRNRRIGLSQSGIVQAYSKFGRRAVLSEFCDAGYNEVRKWDGAYSEWLCVPRSIKVTSIKPSGTVSLLVGATPGIHYPEASTYWRRVRISKDSILVKILKDAGYNIEPAISDPDRTVVAKFAISEPNLTPVGQTSIWQQMTDVADYHKYWADNQVSATVKFKSSEMQDIIKVLEAFEDQIKGVSFLPLSEHGYAQAPYEPCTPEEVVAYNANLKNADYRDYIYEAIGSKGCDGDTCELNNGQ